MLYPPYLTRVSGPSSSQGGGTTTNFDYSGMEDRAKRLDLLPQVKSQKFAALYDGDIAGSVASGHRIRDLIDSIKNPRQPMVRIASTATSAENSSSGPTVEGTHNPFPTPTDGRAGGTAKGNIPKPQEASVSRRPPPSGGVWRTYPITAGQQQDSMDALASLAGWRPNQQPPSSQKPSPLGVRPYPITAGDRDAEEDRLARLAGFVS